MRMDTRIIWIRLNDRTSNYHTSYDTSYPSSTLPPTIMNVNMNSRVRDNRNKQRYCKASHLIKALIFILGTYIGWFVFVIQKLDSLYKTNIPSISMPQQDTVIQHARRLELPLTAHLYINNMHTAIPFNVPQTNDPGSDTHTIKNFPVIDDYPEGDPYLPWIHDVFLHDDNSKVVILAQNRRRCHTGKTNEHIMKEMEPQLALFQPINLKEPRDPTGTNTNTQQHQYTISNHEEATIKETRFQCRFKLYQNSKLASEQITFSQYPFNYEYITWRKGMATMFETTGKGMAQFWLSSLEFHCPVPSSFRGKIEGDVRGNVEVYLDIATIKTPVRRQGEWFIKEAGESMWNVYKAWGRNMVVPNVEESTRWENIYIAPNTGTGGDQSSALVAIHQKEDNQMTKQKPHKLVACTWSSAAHNRRGDAVTLSDGKERLREWIAFNLLVGFDHIVVYDNSAANTNTTSLKEVTDQFGSKHVTHVDWSCKICNNNRPAHGKYDSWL